MSRLRLLELGLATALAALLAIAFAADRRTAWRRASRSAGAAELPVQLASPTGAPDRCPTCHRTMLAEAGLSSTHPVLKGHTPPGPFGCSSCHGGQGRRLDETAHQPELGAGALPFLRPPLLQARCARCHLPGLEAAPVLARGIEEYLDAGCPGCHQPGRFDQGLGPDLQKLGRRSEAELRRAILDPERAHPASVMWSSRWRFDQSSREGQQRLTALLTALLAFSEDPQPFRGSWSRPQAAAAVDCASCHARSGPAAGTAHRCGFLRGNDSLRCASCHQDQQTWPGGSGGECPQVRAARPTCGVCHLRERAGPGRRP